MRLALCSFLLAGLLLPTSAPAQSFTPTESTIRLYEQASGSTLDAGKRVYTFYFNTLRTRFIAAEVTMEYPQAAAGFRLSVGCRMTRPDGSFADGIWKIGMPILAGSTRAVGANLMFGAGKNGWQTGIHKVSCSAGAPLGEVSFQMSPGPSLLGDSDFRLTGVRFFPTTSRLTPPAEREYTNSFIATETAHVGLELTFSHAARSESGTVPVDCYYLSGIGTVMGVMNLVYELEPRAASGSIATGLGWEQPGQWTRGDYLAVCQMHGRPIAVERFTVR